MSYINKKMSLEGIKVAAGERFGRKVDGVFGTIINKGAETLRKVTVRIYFLDNSGQHIGEINYSPVLVSNFSIGDNTPLRPGYRKDFGYNVEDDAPSGWSKKIEAKIVDIEYLDKDDVDTEPLQSTKDYLSTHLSLEGIRVAPGERFGREVDGVFGTIVNNGQKSLDKATIRIFFLNDIGQRIGEKDFSPVLVTELSFGDNAPLRPGYRKDFGFNVEEDAPSGWSKRIEAEIVNIKFSEN